MTVTKINIVLLDEHGEKVVQTIEHRAQPWPDATDEGAPNEREAQGLPPKGTDEQAPGGIYLDEENNLDEMEFDQ